MTKAPLNPPIERNGRTITEAVSTVTWTADPGTRIGPGEFADFPLSLGPLPTEVDQLVLPAVQTYDDGEVVAWDQPPAADGSEPERPGPDRHADPGRPATRRAGPAPLAAVHSGPGPASADDPPPAGWAAPGLLRRRARPRPRCRRRAALAADDRRTDDDRRGRCGPSPSPCSARLALLLGAAPAFAHTRLQSSDPADGASLDARARSGCR